MKKAPKLHMSITITFFALCSNFRLKHQDPTLAHKIEAEADATKKSARNGP